MHSVRTLLAFGSIISGGLVGCAPSAPSKTVCLAAVEKHGWSADFKCGADMLRVLSALSAVEKRKLDGSAFRGKRVAFCGAGAPPGATNDLVTREGFYLRILNEQSKDLRPTAAAWTVLVCGKVLQVLPENNIIVIEVSAKDWIVLETA